MKGHTYDFPKADFPANISLASIFEKQAAQSPDRIAVYFRDKKLSYAELNGKANQLAYFLISKGIKPGSLVGLCLERGCDLIIGVLGILKAGAGYVPLDPEYPQERLQYMMETAKMEIMVTSADLEGKFPKGKTNKLLLENIPASDVTDKKKNPEQVECKPTDVAYVLFTSGSTGMPKGVMMSHRPLVNLITWQLKNTTVLEGGKTLQFAPISFDVSFQEIFSTLSCGGTLVMIEDELRLNAVNLLNYVAEEKINRLFLPFIALQHLCEVAENFKGDLPELKEVITAGEQLQSTRYIRNFFKKNRQCRLWNHYGPTEGHVVTAYLLPANPDQWKELPPIGKPIDNSEIYILDENGNPLYSTAEGELFIGGVSVAKGYLNRDDLTKEKFVKNPFSKDPEARMYKTGDLASYLPDGNIAYLGRMDGQVKVRGYRIELGEIELTLDRHDSVNAAVVIAREDEPGDKRLVAYIIPETGKKIQPAELRKFLSGKLPEYMLPSAFVQMENFPRTPSGKIDRRNLPAPSSERPDTGTLYVAPQSDLEKKFATLWTKLLKVHSIGINDNFFELGGNSLLALKFIAELRQQHNMDLPVVKMYQHPDISSLTKFLSGQHTAKGFYEAAEERFTAGEAVSKQVKNVEDGIAVIGMAGRFPGAKNVEELWKNLVAGKETVRFFRKEELDPAVDAETRNDPSYVAVRGVIDGADQFDAAFFNMNPRLAEVTDPQQRIFLEVAWEAMENSGYAPDKFEGLIGVFAGMGNNTYFPNNVFHNKEAINRVGSFQVMTANEKDYIATRVSYEFNIKGPGLSIHTACSTSLTAVTLAYESLLNRECDMAIAGGVAITVPINSGHIYNEGGMFSKDGHTRTFDADANGTVFSDGAGAVMLKRYKDAVRDGDEIYAVIRGAALNNDGSDKASFTAPSVEGQAAVVSMAQAKGGVDPSTISYIETHGTATPLGDPIEIEALTQAFRSRTNKKQFCAVGSIKSNIGHLTPAAGVVGLIKTCLALKNKILPASLHYKKSNPAIDFENTPFFVNAQLREWKSDEPLRAGVSSFGVGGTNAHVVLEEAPVLEKSGIARSRHLLLLSAKTKESLEAQSQNLKTFLQQHPEINLADAAYTLQNGRKYFNHRKIIVGSDVNDFIASLENPNPKKSAAKQLESPATEIIFMYPGQGSQYVNMGKNLYDDEIVFKEAVDRCAEILLPHMGVDIRTILYPAKEKSAEAEKLLKETMNTQPALFTIGFALSKLWMSWGIQPKGFIGHSIGEFVGAHLAGVFSLEDALMLVANRGKMMQDLPHGSMLSVRMPAADAEKEIDASCSIAAVNGPALCVVSGTTDKIEQLQKQLEKKEIVCKLLITSHAFHSPMMDPIIKPFYDKVKSIQLNKPKLPFLSTVTTQWITDEEATSADYWSMHLRKPVRFAEGIQTLWNENPGRVLLECGPRTTAATLARQQAKDLKKQTAVSSLSDSAENAAEWESMLFALGQLWMAGVPIDWKNFYALENRKRIPLPSYAFEKKKYWLDPVMQPIASQQSVQPVAMPDFNFALSTVQQPVINADSMNRKDALVKELKSVLEESSGMELPGDEHATFIEMGLDSLFLTQAALTISKKYGVKVTFRQLNEEFSSLGSLASHLDKNLPADAMPAAAAQPALQPPMNSSAPIAVSQQGMNPMQMMMMQQMQMMQMMMQQMNQPQQQVAASVQQHIDKSVEIKSHTKATDVSENEKAELAKPFGAIARIEKSGSGDLTDAQQKWLKDFISKYNAKTKSSKKYCQDYRSVLADPRVVTGFKPILKELVYQIVINKSKGTRMTDLDGNEYVDVLNGFGSNFFGWGSDFLLPIWKKQLEEGIELGPQTPLAGECAKLMCEITGYDRAGFCNTGSEAVLGALRIARTVTGRNLIVCFNGSYHGINDEVIVRGTKKLKSFPAAAGIMPESVENMLVLDYGTEESLQIIRERMDEIAAVMIEPIQSRRADFHPKEFIHEVRKITKESGALMIFDEVITGFRLRLGGAQEYYDVQADLSTYGKVIGGNMPIGAIAGRKQFMDALDGGYWQYGDDSVPEAGVTYFAGTFVRHPLAMAAMKEVLIYLKKEGKPLYEKLNGKTQRLVDEINAHSKKLGSPFKLVTFGSLFKAKWETEPAYTELLFALMRFKGVHIMDGFPCFLTLAFTDADVDFVVSKYKESLSELCEIGFIPTGSIAKNPDIKISSNGHSNNGNGQQPPVPGAKLGKDQNGNPAWFIADPERPGKFLMVK